MYNLVERLEEEKSDCDNQDEKDEIDFAIKCILFPIETKTEAWGAVIISMLFIVSTTVFAWLYLYNKVEAWLIGVFMFGLAGLVIIPLSIKNLKNVYSTWEKLELYIEKHHNLELAESDEYAVNTSTFD